jgi:hypothetical protein
MPINNNKKKKVTIAPFASASKADTKAAAKPAFKPAAKMSDYSVDDLTRDFKSQVIQGYLQQGLSSLQYGGHVDFGHGISVPYLIGGWKEQVDDPHDDFNQIERKYSIIRVIPVQGFSLDSLELHWVDKQTLRLVIPWPSWFTKIANHVGLQDKKEASRVFHRGHAAVESMVNNRNAKVENPNAGKGKKRIVDDGVFRFERPMMTGKNDIEREIIRIPITASDIDATKGEQVPEGGHVRVLQIILSEEPPAEEESDDSPIKFKSQRDANLGKEPGGIRSEHIHLMKSRDDRRNAASVNSASVNASASTAITTTATTTTTTTGPNTFWGAEAGVRTLAVAASSLALAAAAAKNDPPVVHEQIDIDVDKEVHGEDDYMPPPDTSGNKRLRKDGTNIIPTVIDT